MIRLVLLCALPLLCVAPSAASSAELYDWNGQPFDLTVPPGPPPAGLRRQPVLFVHGHAEDTPSDPNYRKNFWEHAGDDPQLATFDLTSFKEALDDSVNNGLDIEPYYIRFADRTRSITDDAFDIGEAVDYIIRRHNADFDPAAATTPPPVQIVIIAYSKGTISTRQYLKSLQQQVQDNGGISLPPPRPGYRPVSEFIAISPPNHGIASPLFVLATGQISVQQLYNGVRPEGVFCGTAFSSQHPQAENFMEILNGETGSALDSNVSNATPAPDEAPGSRSSSQGPHSGTLYVTLFADAGNPDNLVGGSGPSSDCAGRALAVNLSSDAINVPVGIPGDPADVHTNTVHAQDVICKALFAAVHHKSPANQTCALSGRVPIIPLPQPAAAMLALDISGSMLARQCTTCPTRYGILKQAVEIFVQLWSQAGRSNDRLGVTYFRTTVDEPQIGGERLPQLAGNAAAIIAHVNGQSVVPTNLTAMGGGLQRSVEALGSLPAALADARHVILFSDGMQNVNPMVLSPQHVEIDNEAGRPASGVAPTNPPMRLDALSPLKIDTIAVGAGAFVGVLSDIATHGQGLAQQTLDANDLRQFFVEQLIDTLREASPQLIGYRRGSLYGTGATESFKVNKGARRLLFKVSWQHGQRLDVRVSRDGMDMTGSAKVVAGDFYRILVVDTPGKGIRGPASGAWRLHISGKPGTAYEAAAIIDDKELRYDARLYRQDGKLGLTAKVSRRGRPVDGPVTVTATVTRPRAAIGNALASIKPVGRRGRGAEAGMTRAERKVAAFLQDSETRDKLRPVTETIRLEGNSRDGFRGVLANARVPGIYRVELRIAGEDRELGPFERSRLVTTSVAFDSPDRAKSRISLRSRPQRGTFALTLRPADRRGRLLGPTYAGRIALTLSAGKVERGPVDLGDGRYRFVLSLPKGENPSIALAVMGQPLFKGTIKELQDGRRRRRQQR